MQAPCPSTKFHKKEKENYNLEKSEITHRGSSFILPTYSSSQLHL
jgi:hypothetical protein